MRPDFPIVVLISRQKLWPPSDRARGINYMESITKIALPLTLMRGTYNAHFFSPIYRFPLKFSASPVGHCHQKKDALDERLVDPSMTMLSLPL